MLQLQLDLPLASAGERRVEPPAASPPDARRDALRAERVIERPAAPTRAVVERPVVARPAVQNVEKVEKRVSRTRLLEDAIKERLGPHTRVVLTDTRTVLASQSVKRGVRTVRLHQMFLDAPHDVRDALARFLVDGNRRAGKVVDAFIEDREHLLALHADPLPPDAHQGENHDLLEIFQELNARYFDGAIEAELTWGSYGSFRGRSRQSITLGSYDYRAKRITMHPVLDQPLVPRLCVARILHHEMCHARHPAEETPNGRRIVHTAAFRREEARFEGAKEADAWLDANLDSILRYRERRSTRRPSGRRRGS